MVHKQNRKLRICIDPKPLNNALNRSHYLLPTLEDLLPGLTEAKVFSVLDVRNGFWHIELDKESSLLTTFATPFGRYRWKRMPFGISEGPEIFQRRLDAAIQNLPGVFTIAEDILVVGMGATEQDARMYHDSKIVQLLKRCKENGLKLNQDKCKIAMPQVTSMGHILTSNGLKPDPTKVTAIQNMQKPHDRAKVRRLMGMINYLSKVLGNLSDLCEPITAHSPGSGVLLDKHS